MAFYLLDETKSDKDILLGLLREFIGVEDDYDLSKGFTIPKLDFKGHTEELERVQRANLDQIRDDERKLYSLEIEFIEKKLTEIQKAKDEADRWIALLSKPVQVGTELEKFYTYAKSSIIQDVRSFTNGNEEFYKIQLEQLKENLEKFDDSEENLLKLKENRISRLQDKISKIIKDNAEESDYFLSKNALIKIVTQN
jgi:hypothetical protein